MVEELDPAPTPSKSPETINLKGILDLGAAADLKTTLEEIIAGSGGVVICAEEVEQITTPCIQLLLACAKELEASGRSFKVQNPPPIVQRNFLELGLDSELDRWTT